MNDLLQEDKQHIMAWIRLAEKAIKAVKKEQQ
jgi:hypothetical protein